MMCMYYIAHLYVLLLFLIAFFGFMFVFVVLVQLFRYAGRGGQG
jgi:hypothetical protein